MESKTVELKLLVHDRRNRVVLAECGSEFVDLLFTILTLPLSTIIRITDKNPDFGSIANLYESVGKLGRATFHHPNTPDMLLSNYTKPKEETDPSIRYECEGEFCPCTWLSTLKNATCSCGEPMIRPSDEESRFRWWVESKENKSSVFVGEGLRFIVTDDLKVMPLSIEYIFTLLRELRVEDCTYLRHQFVYLGVQEILYLLKHSLASKEPLSDAFLVSPNVVIDPKRRHKLLEKAQLQSKDSYLTNVELDMNVKLKLFFNKNSGSVLYAEAREDFVNVLFSFLTLPLGGVAKLLLDGKSDLGCIDNLTNSVEVLVKESYMKCGVGELSIFDQDNSRFFCLQNLVLPLVDEFLIPIYSNSSPRRGRATRTDFVLNRKLVRGSASFMIMNNLDIVRSSSSVALPPLRENRVSLEDVEEKVLQIGEEEVLTLLKASLRSKMALNDFVEAMFRDDTELSE